MLIKSKSSAHPPPSLTNSAEIDPRTEREKGRLSVGRACQKDDCSSLLQTASSNQGTGRVKPADRLEGDDGSIHFFCKGKSRRRARPISYYFLLLHENDGPKTPPKVLKNVEKKELSPPMI